MEDRGKQVSRLYKVIKLLETRQSLTLKEIESLINEDLDEPYSNRTFRRDLEALNECGFPIYDDQNEEGKTVWKLQEDYKRNPIPLTPSEIFALLCGEKLMEPFSGTFLFKSLQELYQKLKANLTPDNVAYLKELKRIFHIQSPNHVSSKDHGDKVDLLNQAIRESKSIEMVYQSVNARRAEKKRVNPYGIFLMDGAIYFIGYCIKDKMQKTYAINRIQSLKITDTPFTADFFSLEEYLRNSFGVFQGKPENVELVFRKPASKWVRERKWHHSQEFSSLKGEKLKMKLRVAVTPDFIHWVMRFGSEVEVIQPPGLKNAIKEEIWKLTKLYRIGAQSLHKSSLNSKNKPKLQTRSSLKKVI